MVFFLGIGILLLTGCLPSNLNEAPNAYFIATPLQGAAPLTVTFGASGSSDPDGQIVSYAWEFGDGGTGSGVSTTHIYNNPGTYVAKLTVTDDQGATDTATRTISVSEPEEYGVGDTANNGYVSITFRGVRSASSIGIWEPDPDRLYAIVDLKIVALQDDQYVSKYYLKIIHSDGRVQDTPDFATYDLDKPFEDADLDSGQWTDGEIAFEVYPAEFYILEWEGVFGKPIRFRFTL
jgi:PKD repeat protein